jgi:dihydroorotase
MEYDLVVEGKVVLPDSVEEAQVGINEGLIATVKKQGLRGARTVRAGSALVFPGFIDSHAHLREPGWEHKEDFRTGTTAAIHGGVTTVFDMPNNPVPTTSAEAVEEKMRLASMKAVVDVRLYAGVVNENIDVIKSLREHVIGFKAYLGKSTGGLLVSYEELRKALPSVAATGRPFSLHCEDQGIIERNKRRLAGSSAPDVHCDIRSPESETECVRKAVAAAKDVPKSKINICHASTSGTLKIVEKAAREGSDVRCEATLHHLYLNRKAMLKNGLLKTNPPLRSEEDRAALLRGLEEGRVQSLVTDHAPHTRSEKVEEGLAGVPGLDDYGHVVSWLLKSMGVSPVTIGRVCSSNPAGYFRLSDRGVITPGKRADLTVIDLLTPERVTAERLQTKCGWSPYEGLLFPGRARWTICGGRILVDDSEISV